MTLKVVNNNNEVDDNNIEIVKLSASSIKTYEQCPKKYYFTYIEKVPRQEWDHFDLGNLCHKSLEIFHKIYMEEGNKKGSLNKLMSHSFSTAKKEFEKISAELRDEAKSLLMDYLKVMVSNGMPLVKGVETPFNFKITDQILLRGFIDRLDLSKDGKFHIVDYKTTKNTKYLDPFQLLIYGLWLKNQYPDMEKFKASYVLLRHSSKTKDYEFNSEDLKKAEKEIISYANKIKVEDQWMPVPTALCNWCDFKNICPAHSAW